MVGGYQVIIGDEIDVIMLCIDCLPVRKARRAHIYSLSVHKLSTISCPSYEHDGTGNGRKRSDLSSFHCKSREIEMCRGCGKILPVSRRN